MLNMGFPVIVEGSNLLRLLDGLLVTVWIVGVSIAVAMPLGLIFGCLMTVKHRAVRVACHFYLEAVRVIPILVWLFIFYFGLAKVFQIHLSAAATSVVVFTLWGVAELGDIVRGAMTSLPRHQTDSAAALGLSNMQIYRSIIIPQAMRRFMPGAINLVTRMIKTTPLVVLIGVVEVLKTGQQIIEISSLQTPTASFWIYGFIMLLYFVVCWPISLWSKRLERHWQNE